MPLSLHRRVVSNICWLALVAAVPSVRPAHAQLPPGNLTVEVAGLKNSVGQVCFSLYGSSEGFPRDEEAILSRQCAPAATAFPLETAASETAAGSSPDSAAPAGSLSVVFEGLASGTYAVSVIHDENEDNQINLGTFGVPVEGFGFSRNPTIRTSAPAFREAAVFVLGRSTSTQVDLIYY